MRAQHGLPSHSSSNLYPSPSSSCDVREGSGTSRSSELEFGRCQWGWTYGQMSSSWRRAIAPRYEVIWVSMLEPKENLASWSPDERRGSPRGHKDHHACEVAHSWKGPCIMALLEPFKIQRQAETATNRSIWPWWLTKRVKKNWEPGTQ